MTTAVSVLRTIPLTVLRYENLEKCLKERKVKILFFFNQCNYMENRNADIG